MSEPSTPQPVNATPSTRLASIDAYRGLVMFLMMAEVLHFNQVARALHGNAFWAFLAHQQDHAQWVGCNLHDLIQPSFSFLVGVALPFSIASRRARGQSTLRMTAHAFWRALLLVLLGVALRSVGGPQTYFTFEDTLSQIGLGYGILFLLGLRPRRDQWIALGLILLGYWAAFALYPLPGDVHSSTAGVFNPWLSKFGLTGFAAHWNKNSNPAWAFDTWFLNLFPRQQPFRLNGGGYSTLSFIPTLGTMILGLLAGGVLCSERTAWAKARWLALAGVLCLASGWLLGWLGICPVVKRILTPSWVLFSGGWGFLILAAFYTVVDIGKRCAWAFFFMVIGMNSITAYCMSELTRGFFAGEITCHFGRIFPRAFACVNVPYEPYQPFVIGACVLLVQWLILFWMYRRKLFVRI